MAQASGSDRRRLGRGLSALMGTPVPATPPAGEAAGEVQRAEGEGTGASGGGQGSVPGIRYVEVGMIVASPFQPRRNFDEVQLAELAASIKSAGLVQPVLVRPLKGGGEARFELIAGERRWRASKLAGLETVPCVVREATDEQAAEWALIENLQRADLSPMERAHALKGLADRFGLTHSALAERLGMDRTSVANTIRLTELETEIQGMLERDEISMGHCKALLGSPPGMVRRALAAAAGSRAWSVRELERAIVRIRDGAPPEEVLGEGMVGGSGESGGEKGTLESDGGAGRGAVLEAKPLSERELQIRDLEKRLGEHLGTKVRISTRSGSGSAEQKGGEGGRAAGGKRVGRGCLHIEFYGLDHFDGLMDRMGYKVRSGG